MTGEEAPVPNKTIYVSDDDLPLLERAQEVAGTNLSSAIVQALRRFVEVEEAKKGGLEEVTVTVGPPGGHRRKRFLGARLARWLQKSATGKGTEVLSVYRTAGRRFALHTQTLPDWKFSWGDPGFMEGLKNHAESTQRGLLTALSKLAGINWDDLKSMGWSEPYKESSSYSLMVLETLEDLKGRVPEELFTAVAQAMNLPDVEELDI
jgi:EXLDI family protein